MPPHAPAIIEATGGLLVTMASCVAAPGDADADSAFPWINIPSAVLTLLIILIISVFSRWQRFSGDTGAAPFLVWTLASCLLGREERG